MMLICHRPHYPAAEIERMRWDCDQLISRRPQDEATIREHYRAGEARVMAMAAEPAPTLDEVREWLVNRFPKHEAEIRDFYEAAAVRPIADHMEPPPIPAEAREWLRAERQHRGSDA